MLRWNSKISIIATQYSDQATAENSSIQSNEDSGASSSDRNLFGIWYNDDDLSEEIRSEMKKRLERSFTYVRIFNDLLEFIAYLTRPLIVTKIFFIITGKNAPYLCNVAKNRLQYEKVYQFQSTPSFATDSTVYTDMNRLFLQISEDIEAYLIRIESPAVNERTSNKCRESILPPPWSIWSSKITENSFRCWKKESPEFFLFQALTKLLTQMECDHDRSLAEMLAECRLYYINDTIEVKKIDDVKNTYKSDDAIWHYTRDSFLFRLVGRAFRSEDFEHIFKFRRYIIDLHWELNKLITQQGTSQKIFRLYRGKKLHSTVLQQLQDNIGALISMNGFLSTTYNQQLALEIFADPQQNRPGYESTLFEFCMDGTMITRTYADISWMSQYPDEEEVLFSIGSVWKIDSLKKINSSYWLVTLLSCNDLDLKIIKFFEEFPADSTLLMLADVLRELALFTKAEKFYYLMLNEPTIIDETRIILYYNIAMINVDQEKYDAALENLQKAKKLIPTRIINTEPLIPQPLYSASMVLSSTHIFNNMALIYQKNGDLQTALQYFTEALNDQKSDRIDKATVYDNIGLLYFSEGEYQTALENLLKAIELAQDHAFIAKCQHDYDTVNKHKRFETDTIVKK